jgi:two-component system sensor histidine kinase YesM
MKAKPKRGENKTTLLGRLWKMILTIALPLMIVIIVITSIGIGYALQYNAILNNVTTASDFYRDFKYNIDLKMYHYVIDSQYSEGMPPINELKSAERITRELISMTTERDSLRPINSVLNLIHSLEEKIDQITKTQGYDSRMDQLVNNVYGMTELIQHYIYTYVYYEAIHLNTLQSTMIRNTIVLMVVVVVLSLALLCFLLVNSKKLSRRIVDPIDKICERLEAIGEGSILAFEPVQADVEEVQILSNGIENMVVRLKRQIEKTTEQEKQRRRTELALLQEQVNPHFLYNTLDTIIWLIESGEIAEAVRMVASLSNYFRFSLSRGKNVITLAEEEQHIRSYLEIQQMRYRDLMEYKIDIPDDLKSFFLPKLTLQPLVENALYHGIKNRRRKGFISVTGRAQDDCLILEVADDGAGMSEKRLKEVRASLTEGKREGFGLMTVHQRIQILFGTEYGLTVESAQDSGTRIIVRIPMLTSDKEMAI